jgi:tetratricopeptide (TPR) repeat protein
MSACTYRFDSKIIDFLLVYTEQLPNHFDLFHSLAQIYLNSYQYAPALEYFEKANKINPDSVSFKDMAYCYRITKKFKEAILYYHRAELQDPHNLHIILELAYCYRETEEYQTSIAYFSQAAQIKPNDIWHLGNIGWCYQKLKQYETALKYHLECEQIDSKDSWNLDNLGNCYQNLGQIDTAISYYEKSINLNYASTWTFGQIGWCYIVKAELEKAQYYLEKAFELDYDLSEYIQMNYGHVLYCLGNKEKALEHYKNSATLFESAELFERDFKDDLQYLKKIRSIDEGDYFEILRYLLKYRKDEVI